MTAPRQTNGGFAHAGAAPDLGVFERGLHPPPSLALAQSGTNVVINESGTWAVGTNYLMASTNLTLPATNWTTVAANVSDLSGNCLFTNTVQAAVPARFYRIRLP